MLPKHILGPSPKPAIVIAAGGAGSRIGGDKPLRLLASRTLLDHAINWAKPQSDVLAIAVQSRSQVPGADLPVLLDSQAGLGPISALFSAFRFAADAGRSHVVMIGCDQPFLPPDLVARLSDVISDHGAAMPTSGEQAQPLATLWRVDEAALADYIAAGRRSIWGFANALSAIVVEWPAPAGHDPFANINDPASLDQARQQAESGRE